MGLGFGFWFEFGFGFGFQVRVRVRVKARAIENSGSNWSRKQKRGSERNSIYSQADRIYEHFRVKHFIFRDKIIDTKVDQDKRYTMVARFSDI